MIQSKIRQIQIEDIDDVTTIVRRCLKEVNSLVYSDQFINYLYNYYSPDLLNSIIHSKYMLVYEEGGKILGTANISLEEKYIGSVFVNPDYHKRGIGTQLMNAIENYARDHCLKKVYVHSSLNAQEFYKKRGFKKIKRVFNPNVGLTIKMRKKL